MIIALEEHYLDPEVRSHFAPVDQTRGASVLKRLEDLADVRIAAMAGRDQNTSRFVM